ncbi:hypothetical protein HOY82DRAFT_651865 [Tuber indicum]|nr:hypothetical protein HOY82DRAFT_651865 [Tuber indicum]
MPTLTRCIRKAPALPFGASAILKQLPTTPSTKVPICKPYNSSLSCHSFNRSHPRPFLTNQSDVPALTAITVTTPVRLIRRLNSMILRSSALAWETSAILQHDNSHLTITAKGVDTGLLDGIFGPINIGQSVKPEKAITVTTRTSTVAPPESTETATMRVTGSEVTVTGETSEVTVTVSAKNAEGVPSTITAHPTSTVVVGDAANARESMPTLSRNREDEKLRPLWRHESTSPKTNCRTQALNINPEETPIPSPLLPQPITYFNVSTSTEKRASAPTSIAATPTGLGSPTTTSTWDSSTREFSKISSSAPAEPSINTFGEVEDLNSHEDIVVLAAELGIEQVHRPSGFVPNYAPKKTATLAPSAANTASR